MQRYLLSFHDTDWKLRYAAVIVHSRKVNLLHGTLLVFVLNLVEYNVRFFVPRSLDANKVNHKEFFSQINEKIEQLQHHDVQSVQFVSSSYIICFVQCCWMTRAVLSNDSKR